MNPISLALIILVLLMFGWMARDWRGKFIYQEIEAGDESQECSDWDLAIEYARARERVYYRFLGRYPQDSVDPQRDAQLRWLTSGMRVGLEKIEEKLAGQANNNPGLSDEARHRARENAMANEFTVAELKRLNAISNGVIITWARPRSSCLSAWLSPRVSAETLDEFRFKNASQRC